MARQGNYVTVRVDPETRDRIDEARDSGESLEDWVRTAISYRLEEDDRGTDDSEPTEPVVEFVDDCGI